MPLADLETSLTEEERAVRDTARRFAQDVLRPVGTALDRLAEPAEVIAAKSALWNVFTKYQALQLDVIESAGGTMDPLPQARMRFLISEELGAGDAGLAISLGVAGFHKLFAVLSGQPALIERFGQPDNKDIGCWAVTEPDHAVAA